MPKVNSGLPNTVFNPPYKNADVLEDKNTGVQTFFGFDGLVYAAQRRREFLDRRIES